MTAIAEMIRPDFLGLAAEVNLFRHLNNNKATYDNLRAMLNAAAEIVKEKLPTLPLYVSVQVDEAWGCLNPSHNRVYQGLGSTYDDFPCIDMLGLSTYPVFCWPSPEKIPDNYFSRLALNPNSGKNIPVLLVEGGWSSAGAGLPPSSPEMQAAWMQRLETLLDVSQARFAGFLMFSDIDLEACPNLSEHDRAVMTYFASMGLVTSQYKPKPALLHWDAMFNRTYQPIK